MRDELNQVTEGDGHRVVIGDVGNGEFWRSLRHEVSSFFSSFGFSSFAVGPRRGEKLMRNRRISIFWLMRQG
jgi:hypothetical protein